MTLTRHARAARLLDLTGVGLFAGTAAWMVLTSRHSSAAAAREVILLVACGLVLVTTRAIGWPGRMLVPAAALVAAIIVAARSRTGVLSTTPLSGPFDYVNADGAFYVQATFAGLMLAVGAGPWLLRVLGGVAAGVFATLPFVVHVLAAAWLVVVLPGLALVCVAMFGARGVRTGVVCSALLFLVTVSATMWLGSGHSPGAKLDIFQRAAIKAVDEHRLVLWNDALNMMWRHPVAGVGAGRYQVVSPIAAQDKDSRWAHSEFLQQGAEAGIPGLLLLVLIFVWAFSRLLVVRSPDVVTALSAAGLAALGIHASIDYVLHFPVIPIVAATLVAVGMVEAGPGPRWLARARAMVEPA